MDLGRSSRVLQQSSNKAKSRIRYGWKDSKLCDAEAILTCRVTISHIIKDRHRGHVKCDQLPCRHARVKLPLSPQLPLPCTFIPPDYSKQLFICPQPTRKNGGHNQSPYSRCSTGTTADNATQNVEFMNNPARFSDVYRFRVTFECIAPLEDGQPSPTF